MVRVKIILIVMFLAVSGATASVWSQAERMTVSTRDMNMVELFNMLQKETSLSFVFNHEDVKNYTASVEAEQRTLSEILDMAFAGKPLRYEIMDDFVVISKVAAKTVQQPAAQAGPVVIRGRVTDEAGNPVIGASVLIKNSFLGVSTDASGNFSLEVPKPEGAVLVVSFIGMRSSEVALEKGKEQYVVLLEPDVANIDAVVVTGYGERSRASFTGSAAVVSKEQLLSAGTKNVFQSLAAFVPGLQLVENLDMGSDPNNLPDILIRGRGSFMSGSTVPTFIVDGAEVDVNYIFDMDMNDIEAVTVLKDAAATVQYGSKASNGVIVITTKPMTSGRMKVSYSGTYRLVTPDVSDYDLLNAREKLEYEKAAGLYTYTYLGEPQNGRQQYVLNEQYNERYQRMLSGVDTDWLSKPLRNTVATNHSVSLYGGEGALRYNLGLRYGNDRGAMKSSGRKRYGISYRMTYNLGAKLFFSNTTNISSTNSSDVPYGSFSDFVSQNPYDSPYNDDGSYNLNLSYGKKNPLYEASLGSHDRTKSLKITNNFEVKYQLTEDFRLDGMFSYSKTKDDSEKFISPLSKTFTADQDNKGSVEVTNSDNVDYQGRLSVSYNKLFADNSMLSIAGGGNISDNTINSNGYKGEGIFSDKLAHPSFATVYPSGESPTGSNGISRALGFYINSNFIYRDRYFVDLSYRGEGSSVFGSNNRWGNFWAVGGGWNIHKEEFLNMNPNDRLKLRFSIGYTGNASFDPYQALTTYRYSSDLYYLDGIGAVPIAIGNPDLAYETALNANVGIDLVLFNNRWNLTFDFYHKTTDNLLLDNTKAPSIGVSTATENVGKLRNIGLELGTRVTIVTNTDWNWAVSLMASHNKNKILKISEALKEQNAQNNNVEGDAQRKPIPLYKEGESISALKVVKSAGIDPFTGKEVYVTLDGRTTFVYDYNDKRVYGDTDPKVYGTVSSFLSWKGWQLNMMFRYRLGATVYNSTLVTRIEGANPENNVDRRAFDGRWRQPGDYAKYRDIADMTIPRQTDRFIQDEYTFSLGTLSLAYDFPQSIASKLGMSRLRAELMTNDLFRLSTVKQERGLTYPFAQTYELSLSITF